MPAKTAKTDRAFTLVEILVVIAITAVLFALLLGPLVNSFRLTQRAQMLAGAQDQARIVLENLTRELGSASYVFGNTTHPFSGANGSVNSNIPDLQFTNFLVLDTPEDNNNTITMVPAVTFNAKLDFVLPRHNANGNLVDPTTGQPITITGTGNVAPTGLTFPLAPGTYMVRYFIGLRNPTQPYATHGEGPLLAANGDNTYVLYRAEFTPTMTTNGAIGPNTQLFTTTTNAQGQTVPEFDDPNFFRYVAGSDINWLDPNHHTYANPSAGDTDTVALHNARVDKWEQIAKPVINLTNVDLVLLPHNSDDSIAYDGANGEFPYTAHSGAVHDPVTGNDWPVVNTSITFRPASVSADATASTTTDYAGAGYGGDVTAANDGLPYVPTVFKATDQSWAFPYDISLYQPTNTTGALFSTQVADQTIANMYAAGDLVEMYSSGTDTVSVYDVTSGLPIPNPNHASPPTVEYPGVYVPMTVTPDNGTINFDMPALPDPPGCQQPNAYNRYWSIPATDFGTGGMYSNGVVDLSQLHNENAEATSPLESIPSGGTASPVAATPYQVANARLVPGSLRVYGPDATPGPNQGQSVLYTQASTGSISFGPNEYTVDYAANTVTLYVDPGAQLPTMPSGASSPVQIAYDYQANMAPSVVGTAPSAGNPFSPLRVKVAYQTRDLLDINLGVRVYDPNNVGPAQIVTEHNQVRIGNSNR